MLRVGQSVTDRNRTLSALGRVRDDKVICEGGALLGNRGMSRTYQYKKILGRS